MKVWAGCHVIFWNFWIGFKLSLIGFYSKVSMAKIQIGSQHAKLKMNMGFIKMAFG
jgi:hypothetical protein